MVERDEIRLAVGVYQFGDRIRIRWGKGGCYSEVLSDKFSPYNERHIKAAVKLRDVRKAETETGRHGDEFYTMRFEDAMERYLYRKRFLASVKKADLKLRTIWLPELRGRILGSIHQAEIISIISKWQKKDGTQYSRSEQMNRLGYLIGVFKHHGIWPNPAEGIDIEATASPLVDKYERDEREAFLLGALDYTYVRPGDYYVMAVIGFACGLRTGEILGLSTDCLTASGEDLHIYRQVTDRGVGPTKTLWNRHVYIPTWARPHIARYVKQRKSGEFLFVNTEGNPIKDRVPLYNIHKKIHVDKDIVLHRQPYQPRDMYCWRHTRASELISQNNVHAECAAELGHGVGVFRDVYAHFIRGYSEKTDRSHLDGVAVPNHGLRIVK